MTAPWRRFIQVARWYGQPAPEHDRRREHARHPLPAVEHQRRHHRDEHHRDRRAPTATTSRRRMSSGSSSWCMWSCAPAPAVDRRAPAPSTRGPPPRRASPSGATRCGVVVHRGGLGREVHAALVDAVDARDRLLDPAAHDAHDIPVIGEVDPVGRVGQRRPAVRIGVPPDEDACVAYPPRLYSSTSTHSRERGDDARLHAPEGRLRQAAGPHRGPGPRARPHDRRGPVLHRRPHPDRVGDQGAAERRARPARPAHAPLRHGGGRPGSRAARSSTRRCTPSSGSYASEPGGTADRRVHRRRVGRRRTRPRARRRRCGAASRRPAAVRARAEPSTRAPGPTTRREPPS